MSSGLVYVVEDNPEMADLIGAVAEECGFEPSVANDAKTFQSLFLAGPVPPVGIILDIVVEDMDANELMAWLVDQGSACPIVLVSGYGGRYLEATAKLGTARGANVKAVLSKPFHMAELEQILDSLK